MVLIAWCCFAAILLVVSLLVHASTFLGIDPMVKWPGVMFIHIAIFPPFAAALYYSGRATGKELDNLDKVMKGAPLWLRILTGVFFVYALVNFAIFVVLTEGGGPHERDGKYLLQSHGTVLRELSEAEYHQHQAYVVRGASGHWMLFSCAALAMLVGVANLRRCTARVPNPTSPGGQSAVPAAPVARAERVKCEADREPPPQPTTMLAGLTSLVLYLACLAIALSDQTALGVVAALSLTAAMVLAMRRRRGFFRQGALESHVGCLAVFPSAIIAWRIGRSVAEFIYLVIYVGIDAAWSHDVAVTFPKEGPSQLSNGELLNNGAWSALMFFVSFPLFAVGTIGLIYLAEHVGRLVEVRRRKEDRGPDLRSEI